MEVLEKGIEGSASSSSRLSSWGGGAAIYRADLDVRIKIGEQLGEAQTQAGGDALDGVKGDVAVPVFELDDVSFAATDHQSELARRKPCLLAKPADAVAEFYFDTLTNVGEYTRVFLMGGMRK